ncbi:AAA family ATPase [Candidatus Marsarchaeota archaeon]|nr:AAA family ATPase [Candidatus Marsarchaeota archaeon]
MAFKVIVDGKPCAGKTTISRAIEAKLPEEYGISTLDAKAYALEKGFLSGLLRKFTESEVDTYKALAYSAVRHTLSYLALEESAWKNKRKYDVLVLQRSPYSFSFMLEAVKSVSGDAGSHEISGLMYGIVKAWAAAVKPDLFIYLTADVETLRERFKNRAEGRDRIHARMIEEDDSRHIELLKGYMRGNFRVIDSTSNIEESVRAVASSIYQAYSERNSKIRAAPGKGSTEKA